MIPASQSSYRHTRNDYKRAAASLKNHDHTVQTAEDAALAFCHMAADAKPNSAMYLKSGRGIEDYFSQHGPSALKKLKRLFTGSRKNEKAAASQRTADTLKLLQKGHCSPAVRGAAAALADALVSSKSPNSDKQRFNASVKEASKALSEAIAAPRPPASESVDAEDTSADTSEQASHVVNDHTAALPKHSVLTVEPNTEVLQYPSQEIGHLEDGYSVIGDGAWHVVNNYIADLPENSVLSVYLSIEKLWLIAAPMPIADQTPELSSAPDFENLRMVLEHLVSPHTESEDPGVRYHARRILLLVTQSRDAGQPMRATYELKQSIAQVANYGGTPPSSAM